MKKLLFLLPLLLSLPAFSQTKADQIGLHICCDSSVTINTTWPTIATAPTSSSFSASPSPTAGAIIRFWNNGCKWTNIASTSAANTPNTGAFTTCDTEVVNARTNHAAIYYTVGGTPSWACSAGSGCANSSMPTDANFTNYIKAMRDRVPASATLTLTSCSQSGTTLTCTASASINQTTQLGVGNRVVICGTTQAAFNFCDASGYDTKGYTVVSVSGTQFTVTLTTSATLSSTGGTAGRPYGCSSQDARDSGCFAYWSGYNEPNNNGTTASGTVGNVADLVHLYKVQYPLVHVYDPGAKLNGPESAGWNNVAYTSTPTCNVTPLGFGSGSYAGGYICLFLTTAGSVGGDGIGSSYIDGISDHFYTGANTLSLIAEGYMTAHLNRVWAAAAAAGVTLCGRNQTGANGCKELINSEYDWGTSGSTPRINSANDNAPSNNGGSVCPTNSALLASGCWMNDQAAFLLKYQALALDGASGYTDAGGVLSNANAVATRMIWYKWADNDFWGGLYCQQSGTGSLDAWTDCATSSASGFTSGPFQKPAAKALGTAYSWFVGLTPAGPCTVTANTWVCPFTQANGVPAEIVWNSSITSSASPATLVTTGFTRVRDMYGNVTSPAPATLNVGYSPQILDNPTSTTSIAYNGTCSTQAIVSAGLTGADVNRTNPIVKCMMPVADGDNVSPSLSSVTLVAGTVTPSAGQFKCTGKWADGSCKMIVARAQIPSYTAGTNPTFSIKLSGGSGNFGGSNLATDNGTTITVSTGAATFVIQKAKFDLFHQVTVGAKTLVDGSVSANEGVVVVGPPNVYAANLLPSAPASAPTFSSVSCSGTNCPASQRTLYASVSYTSLNGESPDGPVTAAITVPANSLLVVNSPPAATNANGYRLYVGTSNSVSALHLQNPFIPLAIGSNWTEPQGCQLSLNDGTAKSLTINPNRSDNPCAKNVGGGILVFTQIPITYAAMGNDGCFLKNADGTQGCTQQYRSTHDLNSTAVIEENGPAEAVIKATYTVASADTACPVAGSGLTGAETPNCYLHGTTRMYFYKSTSKVRVVNILQNADLAPSASGNVGVQASDNKGFRDYYLSVNLAGAGVASTAKNYSFQADLAQAGCPGGVCSGALDGSNDAQIYQAFSCLYEWTDMEGQLYNPFVPPIFAWGPQTTTCQRAPNQPNSTSTNNYSQEGYEIVANGAVVTSGGRNADETQMGWGDLTDSTGAGIQASVNYMGPSWPKAIRFHATGTNNYSVRLKLLPDQTLNLPTATILTGAAQPYYLSWPQYQIDDTFWNFHSAALSSPSGDFLAYQAPLVGIPANVSDWNRAKFFTELYPVISGTDFDAYMKGTCDSTLVCPYGGAAVSSFTMSVPIPRYGMKWYTTGNSGEGNQNEWGLADLFKFISRGGAQASGLLDATGYYRWLATTGFARADFSGGWRQTCGASSCPALDLLGWPATPAGNGSGAGKYPNGSNSAAFRNWMNDTNHGHWAGMGYYGMMLDDQTILDAALQGWPDASGNPNIGNISGCTAGGTCFPAARKVGMVITNAAALYTFLVSQGVTDTGSCPGSDSACAMTTATNIMANQLSQNGFGFGWGADFPGTIGTNGWGVNPVIGITKGGFNDLDDKNTTAEPNRSPVDTSTAGTPYRATEPFFIDMEVQGLLDAAEAFGPNWSKYTEAVDSAYAMGRWYYSEGGWNQLTGNTSSSCWSIGNGAQQNCSGGGPSLACWPGNPCSGNPSWMRNEFYNGDKDEFLFHTPDNSQWMNFFAPLAISGNPTITFKDYRQQTYSAQTAFNEYVNMRGSGGAETGSPEENAILGMFLASTTNEQSGFTFAKIPNTTTPTGHWVDVTVSPASCTGTSCSLTWTNPGNTIGLRMKTRNDGKTIVDWVLLDIATDPHNVTHNCASPLTGAAAEIDPDTITPQFCANPTAYGGGAAYANNQCWYGCWVDDPTQKWPWFSSTEVPISGTPASLNCSSSTTQCSALIPGYDSTKTNTFALKAFVSTAAPPPPPVPQFGHATKAQ